MPRLLPFYIIFPFISQKTSLPFNLIFGMKYVSSPRSSIGQSDRLLICRLCVRFAPGTQIPWWLWCNGSTTSCGDVCTGSNPVSHQVLQKHPLWGVFVYLVPSDYDGLDIDHIPVYIVFFQEFVMGPLPHYLSFFHNYDLIRILYRRQPVGDNYGRPPL